MQHYRRETKMVNNVVMNKLKILERYSEPRQVWRNGW